MAPSFPVLLLSLLLPLLPGCPAVCVCGPDCGVPCLYISPPPAAIPPPPAPPELYPPPTPPPPPAWPYPWYSPPPPGGDVYAAQGGFEFFKPSRGSRTCMPLPLLFLAGAILLLQF